MSTIAWFWLISTKKISNAINRLLMYILEKVIFKFAIIMKQTSDAL